MRAPGISSSNGLSLPCHSTEPGERLFEAFAALTRAIQSCRRCPAMAGRTPVFGPANGTPSARILVVAEAPGRFGGDRTGIPLSHDRTGRAFERRLQLAGLCRDQLFITNAVLCNPRDDRGHNRSPTRDEQHACSEWLAATLVLIDPEVVLTLGAVALAALERITPHGLTLRTAVGGPVRWHGRWLVPLYHPSPRAELSRPAKQQDADFLALGHWLRTTGLLMSAS
jgi:uracil-DNA glycosylase family 4